jgi:hypothetical protein
VINLSASANTSATFPTYNSTPQSPSPSPSLDGSIVSCQLEVHPAFTACVVMLWTPPKGFRQSRVTVPSCARAIVHRCHPAQVKRYRLLFWSKTIFEPWALTPIKREMLGHVQIKSLRGRLSCGMMREAGQRRSWASMKQTRTFRRARCTSGRGTPPARDTSSFGQCISRPGLGCRTRRWGIETVRMRPATRPRPQRTLGCSGAWGVLTSGFRFRDLGLV